MKSGQGCLSLKRTRWGSGVSTEATRSFSALLAAPLIPLVRELDVLRRHRLAVVELHAVAQDELVDEAIVGSGPRLGKARGERLPGMAFTRASCSA